VFAARVAVYPTEGVDVIVYWDSPVTSVHERSIDVCCGPDVLSAETATGIVKYDTDVVDVGLVPDALTDLIVNVYEMPDERLGNVYDVPARPLRVVDTGVVVMVYVSVPTAAAQFRSTVVVVALLGVMLAGGFGSVSVDAEVLDVSLVPLAFTDVTVNV
jgi:hypothetical protein